MLPTASTAPHAGQPALLTKALSWHLIDAILGRIDFVVFEGSCGGPNAGKRFLQHPSDGGSTFCYGRTLTKREPGFDISGIPQ